MIPILFFIIGRNAGRNEPRLAGLSGGNKSLGTRVSPPPYWDGSHARVQEVYSYSMGPGDLLPNISGLKAPSCPPRGSGCFEYSQNIPSAPRLVPRTALHRSPRAGFQQCGTSFPRRGTNTLSEIGNGRKLPYLQYGVRGCKPGSGRTQRTRGHSRPDRQQQPSKCQQPGRESA